MKTRRDRLWGLRTVLRKELADYFGSLRFLLLLGIILVTCVVAAFGSIRNLGALSGQYPSDYLFLLIFTHSSGSIPSVVSFLTFLGPVVGLTLGFDAINGERSRGSLSRILSQPIHRDTVINAKCLAGVIVIAIIILCMGVGIIGMGVLLTGLGPTFGEFVRILVFLGMTVLHMALWLSVSVLFSIVFRQATTSSLCSIAVWIFLSTFVGVIAGGVAGVMRPVGQNSSEAAIYAHQSLVYAITRVSPSTLYSESVNILLNPLMRTVGPIMSEQLSGMTAGFLPLGQSLLLVWPHISGIVAVGAVCFAASYILFSVQEIRA